MRPRAMVAAVQSNEAAGGPYKPPWCELEHYQTISFINSIIRSDSKTGAWDGGYDRALLGLVFP